MRYQDMFKLRNKKATIIIFKGKGDGRTDTILGKTRHGILVTV